MSALSAPPPLFQKVAEPSFATKEPQCRSQMAVWRYFCDQRNGIFQEAYTFSPLLSDHLVSAWQLKFPEYRTIFPRLDYELWVGNQTPSRSNCNGVETGVAGKRGLGEKRGPDAFLDNHPVTLSPPF